MGSEMCIRDRCESPLDSTESVLEDRLDVGMAVDEQGRRERHHGEHERQEQNRKGAVVVHGPHCALCFGELTHAEITMVLAAFPLRRAALGRNGADGWAGWRAAGTN